MNKILTGVVVLHGSGVGGGPDLAQVGVILGEEDETQDEDRLQGEDDQHLPTSAHGDSCTNITLLA